MQNKKVAITGGIGSGKSLLCQIIREEGFPVFSCDEISRALWKELEYRLGLAALFPDCTDAHGIILKEKLSALVFSRPMELERLNRYAHERIMRRLFEQIEAVPFSFSEVPLLFECGYEKRFDEVIVVLRSDDQRIAAVGQRDGITEKEVRLRMARQFDYRVLPEGCHVLQNDGSAEDVRARFRAILREIR